MQDIVYFNGEFMPISEAHISIEDRGYQFADGVYEVIAVYNGRPFKLAEHFERLEHSAQALEIEVSDYQRLIDDSKELLKKNQIADAKLYIQVTRGTVTRAHAYPDNLQPNIVMTVRPLNRPPEEYFRSGVKAITLPDDRWSRCYIKSIALLPNILAKKKAKRAGAFEAILVRDGFAMEGTSSNLFIVSDGTIITPPATNYILNGITRRTIIELAGELGLPVAERSISRDDLMDADEVFLTGTTTEVMPVVEVDGSKIGNGLPGPMTGTLQKHYENLVTGK